MPGGAGKFLREHRKTGEMPAWRSPKTLVLQSEEPVQAVVLPPRPAVLEPDAVEDFWGLPKAVTPRVEDEFAALGIIDPKIAVASDLNRLRPAAVGGGKELACEVFEVQCERKARRRAKSVKKIKLFARSDIKRDVTWQHNYLTRRQRIAAHMRRRPTDLVLWILIIVVLLVVFGPRPALDLSGMWGRLGVGVAPSAQAALARTPRTDLVKAVLALRVRPAEKGVRYYAAGGTAGLAVKGKEASIPPYKREEFGRPWADIDGNGCDTRNDVLGRDLVLIRRLGDCTVASGILGTDPYTGQRLKFLRGKETSRKVQIDHVVALGDAWEAGAWAWDSDRRSRFANDQGNLLAVSGPANEEKGKSTAQQWLPPWRAGRCAYVARQVAVKTVWNLTVSVGEQREMARIVATCPYEKLPHIRD